MESESQDQWFSTQAVHYNYCGPLRSVAWALHGENFHLTDPVDPEIHVFKGFPGDSSVHTAGFSTMGMKQGADGRQGLGLSPTALSSSPPFLPALLTCPPSKRL